MQELVIVSKLFSSELRKTSGGVRVLVPAAQCILDGRS